MQCLCFATVVLWVLGYPDQAQKLGQEALTLAQAVEHPLSLAAALYWVTRLHLFHGETSVAQEQAETLGTLAKAQGFALYVAHGMFLRGQALAAQGAVEEGIAQMRQGSTDGLATGNRVARVLYLTGLAEAQMCKRPRRSLTK